MEKKKHGIKREEKREEKENNTTTANKGKVQMKAQVINSICGCCWLANTFKLISWSTAIRANIQTRRLWNTLL